MHIPDRQPSPDLYGHPVATRASVVQAAHDLGMDSPEAPNRRDRSRHRMTVQKNEGSTPTSHPHQHEHAVDPGLAEATFIEESAASSSSSPRLEAQGATVRPAKKAHPHSGSMNMRALVLHVLGDALGNIGVIATGLVIWFATGDWRFYFDPTISLVITIIIFSSALPLGEFRQSRIE